MKRLLIIGAAALALSACATATPYQPAQPGHSQAGGYSEYRVESDRWRVHFAGNSLTSRETVETYLLFRAAELTVQNGYDWFSVVNRQTERDTRYVGTPDPWYSSRFGPYWGPHWRYYRRGAWSTWGPWGSPWGSDFDVREIDRYEADAEIVMGRGRKPADPSAFDAREVMTNLGPRIVAPAPR